MAGEVAAHAEIGGMAEAEQPDIADQQVEGAGEQREAEQLHQEDGVEHEGRDDQEGDQHAERHELRPGEAPDAVGFAGGAGIAPAVMEVVSAMLRPSRTGRRDVRAARSP